MKKDDASRLISESDNEDRSERAERLIEATSHPNWDRPKLLMGEAARLLFEDVKAIWIYGFFASTIISSAAFCQLQVVGGNPTGQYRGSRGGELVSGQPPYGGFVGGYRRRGARTVGGAL